MTEAAPAEKRRRQRKRFCARAGRSGWRILGYGVTLDETRNKAKVRARPGTLVSIYAIPGDGTRGVLSERFVR